LLVGLCVLDWVNPAVRSPPSDVLLMKMLAWRNWNPGGREWFDLRALLDARRVAKRQGDGGLRIRTGRAGEARWRGWRGDGLLDKIEARDGEG
jgi:hypothetical protein